jgi:3-hydroxyisobutyrate dehydrogenase-like beta-hydroxyacid dehydrogenase
MTSEVGFVGLGNMGMPMACRLLEHGVAVVGCDTRANAVKPGFVAAGGRWADSAAEVASRCETVFASLPTPDAVSSVAFGPGGLFEGTAIRTFIDLSTTGPRVAKELAQRMAARDIAVLDAPVSGGVHGAARGSLTVMVSGPREAFSHAENLFRMIGKSVFYVGAGPGMGQLMKLINNLLSATALAATCEALSVGIKGGLDPRTMLSVLNASTGNNSATQHKVPECVLPGRPIGFGLELSLKDITLCVEAGEAMQVPMWSGNTTRQIWRHALATGGPDQDMMDVARCIEQWAGVKLQGASP